MVMVRGRLCLCLWKGRIMVLCVEGWGYVERVNVVLAESLGHGKGLGYGCARQRPGVWVCSLKARVMAVLAEG